ncbi:MAG: NAD-dependent epimerase/dehydratase family protein, partial [Solirubrobacteraceae bacterium]
MSVKRAFITGAWGFIGRTLAARLRAQDVEVRGVDFEADPEWGVVAGDIAEPGDWQRHAEGCDLVVHTAAIVSNAFDLDTSWRVNVLGTRRALDAAARAGADRFVHISSVRAFSDAGFPPGVDESHPVRPDGNPYVDTKIASEQVALQAHASGEVAVTVIRPADVYGPGSRPWTILPLEAIRSGQFMLPARGRGVFSPVYIENLLDGLLLAAGAPEGAGEVFTLGDGVGVSSRDFFGHYFRMLARRGPLCVPTGVAVAAASAVSAGARVRGVPTEVNATTMRYLARRGTYSIEKARRVLGYEPRIGLEEGMARTEAWLRVKG